MSSLLQTAQIKTFQIENTNTKQNSNYNKYFNVTSLKCKLKTFFFKYFGQICSRNIFSFPNYVLHRLDTRLLERKILIIKNRSFFSSNILIRHLTFKSDVNIKQTFERLLKIFQKMFLP
jgi:hypothetical protein